MRSLPGEMWMTTVIMPPGRLMVRGALACGDEAVPVRQEVVLRRAASEVAFLQSLDQAKWGSTLPVDAVPVDLARYVRAVSEAHGDPDRRKRKPRGVATDCALHV